MCDCCDNDLYVTLTSDGEFLKADDDYDTNIEFAKECVSNDDYETLEIYKKVAIIRKAHQPVEVIELDC